MLVGENLGEHDFEGSVFHPIEEVAVVANLYRFFHDCKITASFGKKVGELIVLSFYDAICEQADNFKFCALICIDIFQFCALCFVEFY